MEILMSEEVFGNLPSRPLHILFAELIVKAMETKLPTIFYFNADGYVVRYATPDVDEINRLAEAAGEWSDIQGSRRSRNGWGRTHSRANRGFCRPQHCDVNRLCGFEIKAACSLVETGVITS